MDFIFHGVIDRIVPPNNPANRSRTTYEYDVLIDYHNGSTALLEGVQYLDSSGSGDDYRDKTFMVGQRVIVICPKQDLFDAYIIGGPRSASKATDIRKAHHYLDRFNEIETFIDNLGGWHVKSDLGPNINVEREKITLDASSGDIITIDRVNRQINIETNRWNVVVKGDANIQVQGQAQVSANNITATARNNVSISSKNATINASKEAVIKTKSAKIDANKVSIAGEQGQVITTKTQPACYVTGIPFVGSTKVKAGG